MKARKIIAALLIIIGLVFCFIALDSIEKGGAFGKAFAVELGGIAVSILGCLWYEALEKKQHTNRR